jgi:hypothetical protein
VDRGRASILVDDHRKIRGLRPGLTICRPLRGLVGVVIPVSGAYAGWLAKNQR